MPFHPEIILIRLCHYRDAIVSGIGESDIASHPRRNRHFERRRYRRADGVRAVLGNIYVPNGSICSQAGIVALKAVVFEELSVYSTVAGVVDILDLSVCTLLMLLLIPLYLEHYSV